MATRHDARSATVSLLYAFDLGNEDMRVFCDEFLEDKKIRNRQKEFSMNLFNNTLKHISQIDELIKSYLIDWSFDRLGRVERAILRLGAYELIFTDIDKAIIINEALEISKEMADEKSAGFINGILDNLSKNTKGLNKN